MAKAVGIDLGTTNSVVAATCEGGQAEVIPNADGARTTPSVVAFTEDGQRLVGQVAKRQAILNPEATLYSVKRFIGASGTRSPRRRSSSPTRSSRAPNDAARFEIRGKQYAPEEISALILRKLADDAGKSLGERVTEAVITVPAYFNDAQRQATKDAGQDRRARRAADHQRADRRRARLRPRQEGAGDRARLRPRRRHVRRLASSMSATASSRCAPTSGDGHLGGDDFDKRIVDWLADEFKRDQGIDLRNDPQALQRLYEAAERAKVELSSTPDPDQPAVHHRRRLRAEAPQHVAHPREFEQLTEDLVERCRGPGRAGAGGREADGRRHRRGHPRRRLDPHARPCRSWCAG